VATALRETEEELGLSRSKVSVLGQYHELLSLHEVAVTPVISYVGTMNKNDISQLKVNPQEIDSVFTVPVDTLCQGKYWVKDNLVRGTIPRFKASLIGQHDIWGLTGQITYSVLRDVCGISISIPGE